MTKQRWKTSLHSFKSHMDPEKEDQLKWIKIEIENNVKRCLKIIRSLHPSRDGHLKRKTELIQLVEEMHKEYQSLYGLYDNLRGEVRKKVVHHSKKDDDDDDDDEIISSCSSSKSSIDETYYSPEELMISDGKYEDHHHQEEEEEKNKNLQSSETTPDSEEDGSCSLKDKMTSISELDETLTMTSTTSVVGGGGGDGDGDVLPESVEIIRELRIQLEHSESRRQKLEYECVDLKENLARAEEEIFHITNNQHAFEEQKLADIKELESKVQSLSLEIETMSLKKRATMEEEPVECNKSSEAHQQLKEGEASGLMQAPEKVGLKVLVKNPKLVVRSLSKKKIDLKDDQIMISNSTPEASNDLKSEKEALDRRIMELETNVKDKENELYTLEMMFKDQEDKMYNQVTSLKLENNNFREDLEVFQAENLELKREKETYSETATQLESKNMELTDKIAEQRKEMRDLEEIISKLKMDQKQTGILLAQSKTGYEIAERKIEEMAEEFCKNLGDNLRILSRRIRVAEQMHLENKELYEKTKQGYEKQNKDLKQKAKKNATELKHIKEISLAANELLSTQDAVALKFEERTANFLNRISKVSCELKFAKDWVKRRNKSMGHVKDDVECLLSQLDDKETEILVSRKKVWKSENKIRELEKLIIEREEGMLSLKEEKREAIRQLCVWIDYHRSRSDYYKKMISDITAGSRKTP